MGRVLPGSIRNRVGIVSSLPTLPPSQSDTAPTLHREHHQKPRRRDTQPPNHNTTASPRVVAVFLRQIGAVISFLHQIGASVFSSGFSLQPSAQEAAFSTSGRLLSPHRSRLHPKTIEAMMCAQNWLWSEINGSSTISGDSTFQSILDDGESNEDDGSCITVDED
nr:hypothetical protein CFP56_48446 [Quercus suber]